MIAYRLVNKKIDKDIIPYGLSNPSTASEIKIANGLLRIKPFNHCIPFFNETEFAFRGINELNTFLFNYCGLTKEDIEQLDNDGWKIEQLNCDSIVKGLSNMILAYFTDSVDNIVYLQLNDFNEKQYNVVKEKEYPNDDVIFIYNSYYKKKGIKF